MWSAQTAVISGKQRQWKTKRRRKSSGKYCKSSELRRNRARSRRRDWLKTVSKVARVFFRDKNNLERQSVSCSRDNYKTVVCETYRLQGQLLELASWWNPDRRLSRCRTCACCWWNCSASWKWSFPAPRGRVPKWPPRRLLWAYRNKHNKKFNFRI